MQRRGGLALLTIGLAASGSGRAFGEEARWNVHLELGPAFNVEQPDRPTNTDQYSAGAFHLRASVEWQLHERVGVDAGYGADFLYHNVTSALGTFQSLFAGVRVKPWFSRGGGFLLPRDPKVTRFAVIDLLSDAWVDAHLGVSAGETTRFLYDIGIGARVPIFSPIQIGLFLRWQQLLGSGDPSFKQIVVGVTGSVGFLPVHRDPDSDDDGVPDAGDRCPNTPRGTPVNSAGCPFQEIDQRPPPRCSDGDLDGVCDGQDDCPDTRSGTPVDAHGCPAAPDAPPQ